MGYQDGNIATAIYSTFNSATGALSGLLGQSASTVPALGWNDLSILGGISIVSGTTYYIALQTHGSSIDFQKSGTLYYEPLTYGSFPSTATLTAVTVNNNLAFNMRMTYSSDSVSTSTTTQPTTTGTTTVASTTTTTSVTSPYTSTSTTSSTTITSATSSTLTSTSSSQTIATNSQPCSYEVFMQGTTTYAENCLTGLIVYSGTAPETVINDAISALPSGGKIFIEAGTYTFTTDPIGSVAAIGTTSINDIELYGAGNSTILAAGTNLNAGMIGVLNANGWYIHDLQINGNRASQSAGGASGAYQTGIVLYDSSNDVVEHCYVHDEKTYGISAEEGSGNQILDNWVVNSDANGIIMYGGSNGLVEGNTVDGASDVGISISGTSSSSTSVENMLCTGNTVLNINLDISPFDANSATGIMVGDNGADSNVTVSNNYVSTLEFGVSVDPASGTNVGVLVSGNTVQSTTIDGVYAEHTTTLTISDNTFTFSSGVAINIGVDVSGDAIQNNTTTTTTT